MSRSMFCAIGPWRWLGVKAIMMSKKRVALVVGVLAVTLGAARPAGEPKYGCVDVEGAFNAYLRMLGPQERIKMFREEWGKKLRAKQAGITKMREGMLAQGSILSEGEKRTRQEQMEVEVRARRALEVEGERRQELLQRELLEEILAEIHALGEAEGYDLLLDKKAVLYGPGYTDVTDELVKQLSGKQPEPGSD